MGEGEKEGEGEMVEGRDGGSEGWGEAGATGGGGGREEGRKPSQALMTAGPRASDLPATSVLLPRPWEPPPRTLQYLDDGT